MREKYRKSPAEMIGIKPYKSPELKRFEKAQQLARLMEQRLKEAKEKIRLSKPYKRSADLPDKWDDWLG